MIEYVSSEEEFREITEGRIHFNVKRENVVMVDMAGNKQMLTGEIELLVEISAKAKDRDHIVMLLRTFGYAHPKAEKWTGICETAEAWISNRWPDATQGRWSNVQI